ncbi:MAG: 30S ribosomal protein S5 [Patescibacteria group bacterium]
MNDITTQQKTGAAPQGAPQRTPSARPPRGGAAGGRGGAPRGGAGASRGGKGGGRGPGFERAKPEFDNKLIQIRRVTRVVSGGRRFSFSVAMVAGNRKGSVGVGVGKASDTALAIEKAMKSAKKNMIKVRTSKDMMIPHEVTAKDSSARVMIMPAPGRGMVAGSSVRNVLDLAGIKNVRAKILSGSKNKLNNARAAIKALSQLREKRPTGPAEETK